MRMNRPKINFRTLLPTKEAVQNELSNYVSDIDVSSFKNKLYEDPFYSNPVIKSSVSFLRVYGDWDMETFKEENDSFVLRLINNKGTFDQKIELSFPTVGDLVTFVDEMYSNHPIKQIGTGMNLEDQNYADSSKTKKIGKILVGIGVGILAYKIINKLVKKNENR